MKWALTTPLNTARWQSKAVLANGQVVATGGFDAESNGLSSWESYDPDTATWTTGTMNAPHHGHTETLLSDGTILVAGDTRPGQSNAEVGTEAAPQGIR